MTPAMSRLLLTAWKSSFSSPPKKGRIRIGSCPNCDTTVAFDSFSVQSRGCIASIQSSSLGRDCSGAPAAGSCKTRRQSSRPSCQCLVRLCPQPLVGKADAASMLWQFQFFFLDRNRTTSADLIVAARRLLCIVPSDLSLTLVLAARQAASVDRDVCEALQIAVVLVQNG